VVVEEKGLKERCWYHALCLREGWRTAGEEEEMSYVSDESSKRLELGGSNANEAVMDYAKRSDSAL
jgi:hypothetical protein